MSRWFRCYDDLVDDPKVQQLPAETFKGLINLWCLASKNNGALPPIADISFKLRINLEKTSKLLGALRLAGLLEDDDGVTRPHNWNGRQFKSDTVDVTAAERMRRYRELRRNKRNGDAPVTVPRDRTEQITETEKKDAAPSGAQIVSIPTPEKVYFDQADQYLGSGGRSLAAKLLKSKDGNVPASHAALLVAVQKSDPREYLGAIIRNRDGADGASDRRSF